MLHQHSQTLHPLSSITNCFLFHPSRMRLLWIRHLSNHGTFKSKVSSDHGAIGMTNSVVGHTFRQERSFVGNLLHYQHHCLRVSTTPRSKQMQIFRSGKHKQDVTR